jgi:nucleoside-diphosphate-sugar epimerase
MNKKILILGGGGFIGGHLGKHLVFDNCFVRIVDRKKHSYFPDNEICDDFVIADLRDLDAVTELFKHSYDEVYQLASEVGGAGYIFNKKNRNKILRNSVQININISHQLLTGNVHKLFFASSSCVYPFPDGDYGHEKLFSERLYLATDTEVVIGRFQNIFGTHDTIEGERERFIAAICRKVIQADKEVEVWGDGSQKRSFMYVEDCVRETVEMMRGERKEFTVENLISVEDVVKLVIGISGKKLNVRHVFGDEYPIGIQEKKVTESGKNISLKGLMQTYYWIKEQL